MEQKKGIFGYIRYIIYGVVALWFIGSFLFKDDKEVDYVEETVSNPTQGIIAHIKEVEAERFKITNEDIINHRDSSLIIATYLDESVDTLTLDEVQLIQEEGSGRNSALRSIAMAGMMGYMMGRPMSSGVASRAYATNSAYNKSNAQGRSQLMSTATQRTVRKPKSGFGAKGSSRSYGG